MPSLAQRVDHATFNWTPVERTERALKVTLVQVRMEEGESVGMMSGEKGGIKRWWWYAL